MAQTPDYDLSKVQTELDVLFLLHHVALEKDVKLLHKTIKRLKAKLGHRIAPKVFNRMLVADEPFELIEHMTENYLAKPPAGEIDLSKHGVCEVYAVVGDTYVHEYIHVDFGNDRVDILTAQRYEEDICSKAAVEATRECGLSAATVNVTLFQDHGFSGKTYQFEIGSKQHG